MKKLLLKDGTTVEAGDEYGLRLIEQGEAVGFAKEKASKAEPKAEEPKAETEAPVTKEAPKKKGK